jgi:type I restriction enzyme R subunit
LATIRSTGLAAAKPATYILLINGVPAVQIELKALAVRPRRAMQQIVDYKNDPGNGYGKTLLCFIQLFIVSNRTGHLVLRQQQRPTLQFQCRRTLLAHLPVRRRGQQTNHPSGQQIYAVKAIVDCIHQNRGNGYVWHTTGSGKTLTSFKASTLLKDNPDLEKCLFVVDRKDLDRQTREEFNRFQEGCVEPTNPSGGLLNDCATI